jgi:Na+/melibiose symporter-like transporter
MHYFSFLIIFLAGISGLCLGVVGFRQYTNITRTDEKVSALQIIKIAARLGASSSLVFFAIMIFGGVLDEDYVWSLQKFGGAAVVSSILGVIVTLGGMYQIYTTVVFRDMLIKKYKKNDKPENRNG